MKNKSLLIITFILFYSINFVSANDSHQALKALKQVDKIMKENYFDRTYGGVDWKKEVKETTSKIKKEKDGKKAYGYIKKLLGKLKHSHLAFVPPWRYNENKKEKVKLNYGYLKHIPFDYAIHEDKLLINRIEKKSDAYLKGLRQGMAISKIGKIEVEKLFSDKKQYGDVMNYLNKFPTEEITLEGVDHNSKTFSIKFKLESYKGQLSDFGNIKGYPLIFRSEMLTKEIGYVKFNIFLFGPVFQTIKAIKSFRNCKGIIIDLRNNPGGIGMLASAIAKEFCGKKYLMGTQNSTAKKGLKDQKFPVMPQSSPIKSKVILLINKSSASTSELMAMGMQENKSAIIIGEKSLGQALPSLIIKLDDGSIFQYPVGDLKSPSGKTLEGVGVTPDFEIPLDPKLLGTKGLDSQIQKAILVIQNKN